MMKIQVEHYGRKIIIEDKEDMDIFELYDIFKTIAIGMTFQPETIDEAIINIANQNEKKE